MRIREILTKTVGIASAVAIAATFVGVVAMPSTAKAASEAQMMRHGGLLYDNWSKITKGDLPMGTHPSYPEAGKKKKATTWRCKECHGWDYMGVDGQYKDGSHFTGVKGIRGAAGKDPAAIVAMLKDGTHAYTDGMFTAAEFNALAMFVSKAQIDVTQYIGDDKSVKGDAAKGQGYYETICGGCHGLEGKKVSDMPPMGQVANSNPWESLHKIRFGHPGEDMPGMIAFPTDVAIDILAHIMTLPGE